MQVPLSSSNSYLHNYVIAAAYISKLCQLKADKPHHIQQNNFYYPRNTLFLADTLQLILQKPYSLAAGTAKASLQPWIFPLKCSHFSVPEPHFPEIRLMGMLGAKKLILTNAAGGVNTAFTPGDLMLLEDHISAFVPSPLRGENLDALGTRFPDMSCVYDRHLRQAAEQAAESRGIALQKGVYLQWPGPNYESPAEIRMFRTLGADAVGMSTVCEAIAARHMGLRVCAVSCITNMACGILPQPLSHEEVQETASRVREKFESLILEMIGRFADA